MSFYAPSAVKLLRLVDATPNPMISHLAGPAMDVEYIHAWTFNTVITPLKAKNVWVLAQMKDQSERWLNLLQIVQHRDLFVDMVALEGKTIGSLMFRNWQAHNIDRALVEQ